MSVMGRDGRLPNGWSPFGDTDEEIRKNMKTGYMPNAPDVIRVTPRTITGSKKKDRILLDMLGSIGALDGQAKEEYERRNAKK